MAWTARLGSFTRSRGKITGRIVYTDGVETFDEPFSAHALDADFLSRTARQRIAALNALDATVATWTPDMAIDVTPPNGGPSNAEVAARRLGRWRAGKQLIAEGLIAADNATVAALKTQLDQHVAAGHITV